MSAPHNKSENGGRVIDAAAKRSLVEGQIIRLKKGLKFAAKQRCPPNPQLEHQLNVWRAIAKDYAS